MLNKEQRIEKVARAIHKASTEPTGEYYPSDFQRYKLSYLDPAKAAIAAYEEMLPSEEEIQATLWSGLLGYVHDGHVNGFEKATHKEAKQINKLIRGE